MIWRIIAFLWKSPGIGLFDLGIEDICLYWLLWPFRYGRHGFIGAVVAAYTDRDFKRRRTQC